jgi:hypothetical protein
MWRIRLKEEEEGQMNDINKTVQSELDSNEKTVHPSDGAGSKGGDGGGGEVSEGGKDQSTGGMTGSSARPSRD